MAAIRSRVYHLGALDAVDVAPADVSVHLARDDTVLWVDLMSPTLDELHLLADELGLHELAVEDALEPHQRPKLDHYASHLFLSVHAVQMDERRWRAADPRGGHLHQRPVARHRSQR
jgi:magnesium transporter